MPMKTPIASKVLKQIIAEIDWDQGEVASKVNLARPQISCHLSGQRPIRDEHIAAYLRVFPEETRCRLLSAWMQDVMDVKVLQSLNGGDEWGGVASVKLTLDKKLKKVVEWWVDQMARDAEMEEMFVAIARRLGFSES